LGNLPELLAAMMLDPRVLVAIADYEDHRYVQFWVEDNFIVAEVISNVNVVEGDGLTKDQEAQLIAAGWSIPDPKAGRPNWHRQECSLTAVVTLAKAAADASTRILRQGSTPDLQKVMLKTFPVQKRRVKRHGEKAASNTQDVIDAQFESLIKGWSWGQPYNLT
jgi:hypothetical protein